MQTGKCSEIFLFRKLAKCPKTSKQKMSENRQKRGEMQVKNQQKQGKNSDKKMSIAYVYNREIL